MIILIGLALASILAMIAWIDFRSLTIPDALNLALASLGVIYQSIFLPNGLLLQIAAGIAVLVLLWVVRYLHARVSGQIGLGLGDVKMAGACAIWLNPLNLPLFMFFASAFALLFAGGSRLLRADDAAEIRRPFGPFLGAGLFLTWLGEQRVLI
ncbi:A24 family peptidase [Nitratireductor sp. ZSWI3]|uniref:prepilin peptidase n=1 Tax=Nitratireductor sp. ZSWI3 TaxID=2966359 RepID=UPI00214F8D71|nr:A24 family peptidase [Nitratireductor sp. ZSWI3]MCR4265782.1 A24 family peptidase [Nitratireductor sp. ZSWI3]